MRQTELREQTEKNGVRLLLRIVQYVCGLFFMAFGVAFSVNSGLGVSPVNSLPYVLSLILKVEMGRCITGVFSCYLLVQIAVLRHRFRFIDLTQLLVSAAFGVFVDLAKRVLGNYLFWNHYIGCFLMLAVSMILVACGLVLYMDAKLVNMPMEGMTEAICTIHTQWEFYRVKIAIDCMSVLLSAILSVSFLGKIEGIQIGTVLSAVLVGKLVPPIRGIKEMILSRSFQERA